MKALFNNIAIIYEIEKLALVALLTVTPVNAAVSDNLDTVYAKLLVWLGYGEESNTPTEEEFDTASLVEKVNYLEEQQQMLLEAVEETKAATTKIVPLAQCSWKQIHDICQAGKASEYGLNEEGTELRDGWYVIGSKKENGVDSLKIWRKNSIAHTGWSHASDTAGKYYNTFNSLAKYQIAYSSGLLSRADVESGWLMDYCSDVKYCWLSDVYSSGYYYYVDSGGNISYCRGDTSSYSCIPYVWIH